MSGTYMLETPPESAADWARLLLRKWTAAPGDAWRLEEGLEVRGRLYVCVSVWGFVGC